MKVSDWLEPEHFHFGPHARIYAAALDAIARGGLADPLTLKARFAADDGLKEVGGAGYLARLVGSAVTLYNVEHYGENIRSLWFRRRMIEAARELEARAFDDREADHTSIREWAEGELYALGSADATMKGGPVHIGVAADEMLAELDWASAHPDELPGVTWGLRALDLATGGLEAGKVYVVAGRPAMGKSALLSATSLGAGRSGAGTGIFSHEMKRTQYLRRMACDAAWERGHPIYYSNLKRGLVSPQERARIGQAAEEIKALPIEVDDRPDLTVPAIRSATRQIARRLEKRGHPLKLIGIDYLGLVKDSGRYRENKVAAIGEISRGLKIMARELDIAVLLLAQLNRESEKRGDKRPQLADLRGSGDIEQDADLVLLLHREAYYVQQRRPPMSNRDKFADWESEMFKWRHKVEVILAKQREGGNDPLEFYCDIGANVFRDGDG